MSESLYYKTTVGTQTFWKQNRLSQIPFKTNIPSLKANKRKPLKTISTKSQRNFNSETREKLIEKGTVGYS